MKEKKVTDLGKDSIGGLLLKLALPAILAQIINVLYNMVDRMYIGHIPKIGSDALTGVGVTMPVIMAISAFAALVSMGGAPRASIMMGKNDKSAAEKILGNCTLMLVIMAAILTCVFFIWGEDILLVFGASSKTIGYALEYMRIYSLGTIFVQLALGLNAFINAQGYAKMGMFTVAIGAICNIILDPIFIFQFSMGVKGAALATIISQAFSAIWILSFLTSNKASLKLEKKYIKLNKKIIMSILALGISPFIMASTESLVGFVLNSSLKEFGDIYISSLTVMQSAMLFVSVPLAGFSQGFIPVASYNYGHGNYDRVKECFRIVVTFMFSFNFILIILMILFPHIVASAFTKDILLIETVEKSMPIFLSGMTIFGLQRACQNMFVALGQAKVSVFIALLRKVILLIPLALILPKFMGVNGIFAAEGFSDATAAIICTAIFAHQFPKILKRVA